VWDVVYRLRLQNTPTAAAAAAAAGPDMGRVLVVMNAVGSLLGPDHAAMLFLRLLHTGEPAGLMMGIQAWLCFTPWQCTTFVDLRCALCVKRVAGLSQSEPEQRLGCDPLTHCLVPCAPPSLIATMLTFTILIEFCALDLPLLAAAQICLQA
jgi:hypothetical protein